MSPDAPRLALLQHAQQLHLEQRARVADLVEEQRAPVRGVEQPDAVGHGAGERAARVPEQLALDQAVGRGAAVVRDEAGAASRALSACTARATSSLPVPVSPSTSTGSSLSATRGSAQRTTYT